MTFLKSDNDIVIVQAIRTPFLKAKNILNDDTLLSQLLSNVKVENIEEVILGNVLSGQGGVIEARSALLMNGMNVPVMTINKQCCSGLEVIKMASERVRDGCIIAGGFENMSNWKLRSEFNLEAAEMEWEDCNSKVMKSKEYFQQAKDCGLTMGETSEILAQKFNLERSEIDQYAFETHQLAYEAMTNNKFKEIVSVTIADQTFDKDNGIRFPDIDKLKSLRSVFRKDGVSTAGNSSQLSDGAALVVVCRRSYAEKNKLNIICRYVGSETALCEPSIMGYSPVNAIRRLYESSGINESMIKYFEVNEAFGSQALCCMKELNLKRDRYNVFGGSIALKHPVGASGVRLVGTLASIFSEKKETGYGIAALCAATGLGMASLFYFE